MSVTEYTNPELCACHSPQEDRIFAKSHGKKDKYEDTHKRVFKMIERFDGQTPGN